MSTQRHYSEQEIAAIFERAARAQEASRHANPHEKGLSLEELQAIGAASGITADFIAQAAATIEHVGEETEPTRLFGRTIGIGRTVDLPGKMTDEAWERLVVYIRETFQAKGKLQRDGSLRQWTNGNLQVLVEPTETGERLRMKTQNENLQAMLVSSVLGSLAMAALMLAIVLGGKGDKVFALAPFLLALIGMFGYAFVKLPGWSRTRTKQMEALGNRAVELTMALPEAEAEAEQASIEAPLHTPQLDLNAAPDPAAQPDQAIRSRLRE